MKNFSNRTYGLILVFAAAGLWSTAGLFVRQLGDMDVWTMLTWRALFAALSLALVVIVQNGRNSFNCIAAMGRPGLIAIPISALSMICYVLALKLTTVANVMVMYATSPFLAAAIAYAWFGEKPRWYVLLATTIALSGIMIMVGGVTRQDDLTGSLMAFVMTFAFALQLVMARRYQALDMGPINAIAAAASGLICLALASTEIPSAQDMVVLALFGMTTTAAAYSLYMLGGRHIPSGEAGFIGLIEVIIAPFWVWLLFDEQPAHAALVGGAVVLAAVVFYLVNSMRKPANT